ncbi:MAG TPA: glycoside hydrolase family 19 protein [Saprospiraceae bacterium]|nr:glycoside hydrolase family 19 protein [Saprospiraceae bacterium]
MTKKTVAILSLIAVIAIVAKVALSDRDNPGSNLFELIKKALENSFGILSAQQIRSILDIVQAWTEFGDGDMNKLAYILATCYHESKFISGREKRCNPNGDAQQKACYAAQEKYWYTGYYGRGFVQLTHRANYIAMSSVFNIDLESNPDLALDSAMAAKIAVYGMMTGSFTGLRLSNYINLFKQDYYNARRVVNGLDRADLIQAYALKIIENIKLLG